MEDNTKIWYNILIAVVAIAAAVVAVAATVASGGAALTIILAAASAVIKIAAGAAVAFYAVNNLHLGSSGFYLPEYQLTPDAIFRNEIIAFDVNFFNPKDPEITSTTISNFTDNDVTVTITIKEYSEEEGKYNERNSFGGGKNSELNQEKRREFVEQYLDDDYDKYAGKEPDSEYPVVYDTSNPDKTEWHIDNENPSDDYSKDERTGVYVGTYKTIETWRYRYGEHKLEMDISRTYINGWTSPTTRLGDDATETTTVNKKDSPAFILRPTISSWYLTLRNIALVALLSILVYVGIRITLASVASDKAKYKQMLVDWTVALALVFLMHYIMSFSVAINEKIIEAISSIGPASAGTIDEFTSNKVKDVETKSATDYDAGKDDGNPNNIDRQAVHLFRITDGAKKAYQVLVGSDENDKDKKSGEYSRYTNRFELDDDGNVVALYWPAYDYMTQARMLGQGTIFKDEDITSTEEKDLSKNKNQEAVVKSGYKIIYVVLVIYTVIFCFIYLKRIVYMAFLTVIAPLVAITYPIDKIGDGKAQAFNMWLREYIFNLLIQPVHLILYTILVTSAIKFAANNIFYAVVAIGFLVPAEKILRRFFGFDQKAQTPGVFEGAAGAALLMTGLNKIMNLKPSSNRLDDGQNRNAEEDEGKIREASYSGEDPFNALLIAGGEPNININATNGNTNTQDNIDHAREPEGYTIDNQISGVNTSAVNFEGRVSGSENGLKLSIDDAENQKRLAKTRKEQEKNLRKITRSMKFRRALARGMSAYGDGIKRRYTMNKQLNGGALKRGIRMAGGIAAAGTLAAAGGIAGLSSGDPSKVAKYMGTGAIGGYSLGKAGVTKATAKLEEQYKDAIKEAKIGYHGEKEYAKRNHEKWKEQTFEKNNANIIKIQNYFSVSKEDAKRIAKEIAKYTDKKGIKSLQDAMAVKKLKDDEGFSEEEAILAGYLHNVTFGGKNSEQLSRKEREGRHQDLKDKLISNQPGISSTTANMKAEKLMNGTVKFSQIKNDLGNENESTNNSKED